MRKPKQVVFGGVAIGLAASLLGGCDWREFDNLKDDLWVSSNTAPSGLGSALYGDQLFGLQAPEADGTMIAVVGRNQESVSGLEFDPSGVASTRKTEQSLSETTLLGEQFNFIEFQPFAREAGTNRFAFALVTREDNPDGTVKDNFKIAVMQPGLGTDDLKVIEKANTYEPGGQNQPPSLSGLEPVQSLTFAGATHLVAARSDRIMIVDEEAAPDRELMGCHVPAGERAFGVAFGEVGTYIDPITTLPYPDVVAGGDIIIASAPVDSLGEPTGPGHIWVLVGGFAEDTDGADCVMADGAELTGIEMKLGTELLLTTFGDDAAPPKIVATVPGVAGRINVVDLATVPPALVRSDEFVGLHDIELADLDGDGIDEIILGQPTLNADGDATINAGKVVVLDADFTPILTLADSDPQQEQRFGTAVTTTPFVRGGVTQNIIVVGGAGEVFTYFRTQLYTDVRAGRE